MRPVVRALMAASLSPIVAAGGLGFTGHLSPTPEPGGPPAGLYRGADPPTQRGRTALGPSPGPQPRSRGLEHRGGRDDTTAARLPGDRARPCCRGAPPRTLGIPADPDLPDRPGPASLIVALRERPTLRHYDPEVVEFWATEDGRGAHETITRETKVPLSTGVSWGEIRSSIVSRVQRLLRFRRALRRGSGRRGAHRRPHLGGADPPSRRALTGLGRRGRRRRGVLRPAPRDRGLRARFRGAAGRCHPARAICGVRPGRGHS